MALSSRVPLSLVVVCALVAPLPAQDEELCIPDQSVFPGQQEVWFPVLGSHPDPIEGFQIAGEFDAAVLSLRQCSISFTATGALEPEFFECNVTGGSFAVGVLFDFSEPFDGRSLPPAFGARFLHLVFDVSPQAEPGTTTRIPLANDPTRRIQNILVPEGGEQSLFPRLCTSTVRIVEAPPPESLFVRGDANGDRVVDIADAVKVLGYLFLGDAPPPCLDAADAADRGRVDISSGVAILNFLFLRGEAPWVPFPNPGLDPSPDGLGDC